MPEQRRATRSRTITPGRTTKEYYQDNKERIAVHQKEYYHDNKETIAAYQKEYRKAYWATHKEVIARKASQPHNCLCGGKYITSTKARHEKSPKHQAYLQQAKKVDELLNQFVQELGL